MESKYQHTVVQDLWLYRLAREFRKAGFDIEADRILGTGAPHHREHMEMYRGGWISNQYPKNPRKVVEQHAIELSGILSGSDEYSIYE
jgi:hypothetical protein